jgi:hypothetical protein
MVVYGTRTARECIRTIEMEEMIIWNCCQSMYVLCGNREEEREGCCIEGATASDYIHKRAE